jgi:hypothetical protein
MAKQKKSQEDFVNEFNKKHQGRYSIISTYNGYTESIKAKCNKCDTEWEDKARNLLNGSICPNCGKHELFLEKLKNVHGSKFIPLEKYISNKIKISIRCNDCQNEWSVNPKQLLEGKSCPKCLRISKTKTHAQFVKEVYEKFGDKYIVIGTYINASTPVKIKCNDCKNEWSPTPSNLLRSSACTECLRLEQTKANKDFLKELSDIHGNKYVPLEEYKTIHNPILCKCTDCDHVWTAIPSNILRGTGCPKCSDKEGGEKRTKSNEEFLKELKETHGELYIPLERYYKGHSKIKVKCNKCNTIFEATPTNLIKGQGCGNCNKSKGEARIQVALEKHLIEYIAQKTFSDCRNDRVLPFDFGIIANGDIVALIEYDGIQHFKPVKAFGGEKAFEYSKVNDEIKTVYCTRKSIPLLRIPYWNLNKIEPLLIQFLKEINVIKKDNE